MRERERERESEKDIVQRRKEWRNRLSERSSDNFKPAGAEQKPVQPIQALSPLIWGCRAFKILRIWENFIAGNNAVIMLQKVDYCNLIHSQFSRSLI